MKRLVALLMTACLVGTMLVGCGQKEEATSKSDVETKEEVNSEIRIADVDVEIFDINSVEYHGTSVLPLMAVAVIAVTILTIIVVIIACKPRTYEI